MKHVLSTIGCLGLIYLLTASCNSPKETNEKNALSGKLSTELIERPTSVNSDSHSLHSLGYMQFEDTLHNFGRIHEGEILAYEFSFVNSGNKDLLISEAKASCGCTVPEYPHQPIRKGEQGSVKVTFNSQGKRGYNEKSVILYTNGNPSSYTLYIQAEVGDAQ